jgi:hypothetical protein
MNREPNHPQNNRDFGTYGESFPPYLQGFIKLDQGISEKNNNNSEK